MAKLDHLAIAVSSYAVARDWYIKNLDLKPEFDLPDRRTAAVQDESGFTVFLAETTSNIPSEICILYFQVADVEAKYRQLSASGVEFVHPPRKEDWGYGAELRDPSGYRIRLWDETSMREKGQG